MLSRLWNAPLEPEEGKQGKEEGGKDLRRNMFFGKNEETCMYASRDSIRPLKFLIFPHKN